jgi:cyclic pyranopterin phosphate synthase
VSTTDALHRPLRDLRISVTDRCNFRCVYCMPKEVFGRDYAFLPREQLLSFEELERLSRIFVRHGVEKIRLTGGEPLVRRDVELLVGKLAGIDGLDLTLTTNGSLLPQKAQALADAGLRRITVSLDSLDDEVFRAMNDVDFPVQRVLAGIEAAAAAGLAPVKVNMVVRRGLNEDSVLPMARHFRESGHILRFWRYRGGGGEIGLIASVTQPFCGDCTRARVSADGKLYTCLFAVRGHDLRAPLRSGASDAELSDAVAAIWRVRDDRYSELRTAATADLPKVEMSYIGG